MYPNEYCHRCEPELPPIEVPLPPVCEGEECQEVYPGTCVKYTGPALPCLNISQNESLNAILIKISERLCDCCDGGSPVNCVVSEWGPWSECVDGSQTRTRTIVTPPSNGGAACPPLTETRECLDSCTPLLQTEITSPACEQVEVSFIDDGSGVQFIIYLSALDGTLVDSTTILGTGNLQNYSHLYASVPAGTYFAKIEKFCEGQEFPVSSVTAEVDVIACIPPCESTTFSTEVLDCGTVGITLDNTGSSPIYDVQYKPSNTDVWVTAYALYDATTINQVAIGGLTAGIQYEIRVRNYCSSDSVSLWTTVVVLLPTCPVTSCPRPAYTVVGAACDQLTINLDDTSTSSTIYDVQYRVVGGQWINFLTAHDATLLNSFTWLVTPQQTYEVQVRRKCGETYSDWVLVTVTLPACEVEVCPDPVFTLTGDCTSITVDVTTGLGNELYDIQYRETGTTTWSANVVLSNSASATIQPLLGNTSYDVRVRRSCGNLLYSNWVQDVVSTTVCLTTQCYEVIVYPQEGVDVGTYYIRVIHADGTEEYVLIDGFQFNSAMNGFVGNVCSASVPELFVDTAGTAPLTNTLEYNNTGVTCSESCNTLAEFTSVTVGIGATCQEACGNFSENVTQTYYILGSSPVLEQNTVLYVSGLGDITGLSFPSIVSPLTGVNYVVYDGNCYEVDAVTGEIISASGAACESSSVPATCDPVTFSLSSIAGQCPDYKIAVSVSNPTAPIPSWEWLEIEYKKDTDATWTSGGFAGPSLSDPSVYQYTVPTFGNYFVRVRRVCNYASGTPTYSTWTTQIVTVDECPVVCEPDYTVNTNCVDGAVIIQVTDPIGNHIGCQRIWEIQASYNGSAFAQIFAQSANPSIGPGGTYTFTTSVLGISIQTTGQINFYGNIQIRVRMTCDNCTGAGTVGPWVTTSYTVSPCS